MSSFTQQSPDVIVNEVDLTNIIGGAGSSSGAFAGDFAWGPVEEITTISSPIELESTFGKPNDQNFVDWFSAFNFLAYTADLKVVRVVDENATNATDSGTNGTLIKNRQHFEIVSSAPNAIKFAARFPGDLGNSLAVHIADASSFEGWEFAGLFDTAPGTSDYVAQLGGANDELHIVVTDARGAFTGVIGSVLETYPYVSKAADAKDGNNAPAYYLNAINRKSRYIWAMNPLTTETQAPASGSVGTVTMLQQGTGWTTATITFSAPPAGGVTATGQATISGGEITGIVITEPGSGYLTAPTITITGDGNDASAEAVMTDHPRAAAWGSPIIVNGVASVYNTLPVKYTAALDHGADSTAITANELIVGLNMFENQEEVDASLLILGGAGGPSEHKAVVQHAIDNIVEVRKDMIMFFSPLLDDVLNKTQSEAANAIVATRNNIGRSSSRAVMDSGWKFQYDVYNDKYRWIPLNADIAGLCAQVDNTNDPWVSPGGYNRGRLKNVVSLAFNPNKTARDAIYKNGINPVVTFRTDGTILYGDKTLLGKNSAFSQIGTRRLFDVLEKSISQAAKYFLFEINNEFTRAQFVNMVEPFINEVIGRGGIDDGRVICDETNNGPEVRMNRQFVGSIFIKPNYSINWIKLNFVAIRQDVSFEEVVGATF